MTEVPSEVSSPVVSTTAVAPSLDLNIIHHKSAQNKIRPQGTVHSGDNKDRSGVGPADTRPSSADIEERRSNGRATSRGAGVNISQASSVSGGVGGGGSGAGVGAVGGGGGGGGSGAGGSGSASGNHTGGLGRKQQTSFFSGSKIKHLKKPDGVPLWRKDIQFEFLEAIFTDSKHVFTNSYDGRKECTFADVYIDAMARSSKTSKILRDKLMSERANALNMAMVCLLVNVGRMNTTLNFFPEMKAQLRTYHAIPSLQSYTDAHAYKQLQDAPRLKSILKGACEDRKEPLTLEQLHAIEVPRTNPINLVFLLSTYAPKVSELHFPESRDFYDLIMRSTLSSKSRARAFLWLMWWYLEGDFSAKSAIENPYGKGQEAKDGGVPCKVPQFEHLTEEQAALENVDAAQEIEFGERMQIERKKLIEEIGNAPAPSTGKKGKKHIAPSPEEDGQSPAGSPPLNMVTPGERNGQRSVRNSARNNKPRNYSHAESFQYDCDSDNNHDQTRSASPQNFMTPTTNGKSAGGRATNVSKIASILNDEGPDTFGSALVDPTPKNKGGRPRGSGKRNADGEIKGTPRIILRHGGKQLSTPDASGHVMTAARSIQPSSMGERGSPAMGADRGPKQRPLTSHQLAVQKNRKDRADYMIDRKLRSLDKKTRKMRLKEGPMVRAWRRIKDLEDPFAKSDDERELKVVRVHDMVERELETNFGEEVHSHGVTEEGALLEPVSKKIKLEHNDHRDFHNKRFANGTVHPSAAGLIPVGEEDDDYGEESSSLAAAVRRATRRLLRWEDEDRQRAARGLAPATVPDVPSSSGPHQKINSKLLLSAKNPRGRAGSGEESAVGGHGGGSVMYDETREPSYAGDEDEEMLDDGDEDEDMDADMD